MNDELPNIEANELHPIDVEKLALSGESDHPVRVLMLYGSLRKRSFSRLMTEEAARVLKKFGAEVRIFNPFKQRWKIRFFWVCELLWNLNRLNRRMHNKVLIADNVTAIIGGRNIGDEFFGLNKRFVFRDLDLLIAGAEVKNLSFSFDLFWNSLLSKTARRLIAFRPRRINFRHMRKRLKKNMKSSRLTINRINIIKDNLLANPELKNKLISSSAQMFYDLPDINPVEEKHMAHDLYPCNINTKKQQTLISAYLIPSEELIASFQSLLDNGVRIQVLTNSLASIDVTPAFTGYERLVSSSDLSCDELMTEINFRQLIFARQWFTCNKDILSLPETNRLPDILNTVKLFESDFYEVELDYPDTNEGKSLNKFCKQFKPHLINALKKNQLLSAHAGWRLHLFFTDSHNVMVGIAPIDNSATDAMGISRLKMPGKAPSRSTLKLEEAIHWFLSKTQQTELIRNGMTAVDLGAAPGGWTWQFVQRDCLVTAIDNGPMDETLMKTGMVEHLRTDAFTYAPKKKVDWLVCDMAERPFHVSRPERRREGERCRSRRRTDRRHKRRGQPA